MPSNASPRAKSSRTLLAVAGAMVFAIAILLLTQRALAEQVGSVIASVWVSTMSAVLQILAPLLGG